MTAEDKDPYAKATKINHKDFRRERRDECLHQMRVNQWQWLEIETLEVREACLQQMRLNLQQQLKLQWIERLINSK